MSIAYPIFPGFKPANNYTVPPRPVRSPTWNFKETLRFQNDPQQAVSGRTTVTKYWSNPLRTFEWKYGYIKDNPTDHNPFYPVAIPGTDFAMLKGFYEAMQGSGNQFAYVPPSYQTGGTWAVSAVSIAGNLVTFTASGAGSALALKIGYPVLTLNTAVGAINGQYMYVVSTSGANTVVCAFTTSSTSGGSGGCITIGNVLGALDSNNNVELTYTSGSYPNFSGMAYAGTVVPVVESVQLADGLILYDGNGAVLGSYSVNAPNSVTPPLAYMPYVGYVISFSPAPTVFPITASYNLYYICRFPEDMQEYENFMAACWMTSSVKFAQDRI